jgi:hypothetical protein
MATTMPIGEYYNLATGNNTNITCTPYNGGNNWPRNQTTILSAPTVVGSGNMSFNSFNTFQKKELYCEDY